MMYYGIKDACTLILSDLGASLFTSFPRNRESSLYAAL